MKTCRVVIYCSLYFSLEICHIDSQRTLKILVSHEIINILILFFMNIKYKFLFQSSNRLLAYWYLWKESWNGYGQQFHQFQQNE